MGSVHDRTQTWLGAWGKNCEEYSGMGPALEAGGSEEIGTFYLLSLVDSVRARFSVKGGGYCGILWQRHELRF